MSGSPIRTPVYPSKIRQDFRDLYESRLRTHRWEEAQGKVEVMCLVPSAYPGVVDEVAAYATHVCGRCKTLVNELALSSRGISDCDSAYERLLAGEVLET